MQAIELAKTTFVQSIPNPKVACLIVSESGEVVGEGVHGQSGKDHAEVIALSKASARARGATAYVTLEPCGHVGATGPCVDALLSAGIKRVVFAVADPVHGGKDALMRQGVKVLEGVCEQEAREGLAHWLHAETCATPFVTLKVAASLDGYIAAVDGSSQWITSKASRVYVQQIRLDVDAIVTSTATVQKDNPRFSVRDYEVKFQPHVYVLGKSAVVETSHLEGRYTHVASHDPRDVVDAATKDGMRHLLIEAGGEVAAAFLRANLVNRIIWVSAPKILGDGKKAVQGLGIESLSSALQGDVINHFAIDDDFVTILRMNRCSH